MIGRLLDLTGRDAQARAAELLARFDLTEAGGPAGQDVLRRHAAPPRPGRQPGRPPVGDLPRRADDRPGPGQARGRLGASSAELVDDGIDRAADHPVPGGGRRARRRHLRHRPRQGHRARHPGGAQAASSAARPSRSGPSTAAASPRSTELVASVTGAHAGVARSAAWSASRSTATRRCSPVVAELPTPRHRGDASCRCGCPAWTRSSSPSPAHSDRRSTRRVRHEHARRSTREPTPASPRARDVRGRAGRSGARCGTASRWPSAASIKIRRTPEQLVDVTLQPILFVVLFVYLFGGAIAGSQHDYLQFVLPGDHGADGAVRLDHDRGQPQHRHQEGRLRPVPEPADRPVGAADRRGARRRGPLRGLGRRAARSFGYVLGFRIQHQPVRGAGRLPAGPAVRPLPVLGRRCSSGMLVREPGGGAGHRVPAACSR